MMSKEYQLKKQSGYLSSSILSLVCVPNVSDIRYLPKVVGKACMYLRCCPKIRCESGVKRIK